MAALFAENLDRLLIIGILIAVSSIGLFWLEPNLSLTDAFLGEHRYLNNCWLAMYTVTFGGRLIAIIDMIFLGLVSWPRFYCRNCYSSR